MLFFWTELIWGFGNRGKVTVWRNRQGWEFRWVCCGEKKLGKLRGPMLKLFLKLWAHPHSHMLTSCGRIAVKWLGWCQWWDVSSCADGECSVGARQITQEVLQARPWPGHFFVSLFWSGSSMLLLPRLMLAAGGEGLLPSPSLTQQSHLATICDIQTSNNPPFFPHTSFSWSLLAVGVSQKMWPRAWVCTSPVLLQEMSVQSSRSSAEKWENGGGGTEKIPDRNGRGVKHRGKEEESRTGRG